MPWILSICIIDLVIVRDQFASKYLIAVNLVLCKYLEEFVLVIILFVILIEFKFTKHGKITHIMAIDQSIRVVKIRC